MDATQKAGIPGLWRRLQKLFAPGWMVNRRVRITLSGWLYNGLILFFGFSAINTGNNLLYLILAVMISLMIASFWLSEMAITDIVVSRDLPESIFAGEEFMLPYTVRSQRRFWPNAGLEVMEKVEGKNLLAYFPMVRAKKQESVYVKAVINRRGAYEFKDAIVRTYFPFGFFVKDKKLKIEGRVVVLPSPVLASLDPAQSGAQTGVVKPGQKGPGTELFGFRDYQPGDHPHWIDWKASARSSQMLVRETEQESEQSVVILLKIPLERPQPDSIDRERSIRKAYGLAKYNIDQGWRVRVQVAGRGVDFGAGMEHLKKIAHFLAMFDDLEEPNQGDQLSSPNFRAKEIVVE
jgi:uncharacterized protein (DUF58 family)